jgi:hypothetical protein
MTSAVHPADLTPEELLTQCEVRRTRRGGPGGQHRNKVETAVVLEHRPTGIRAEANERRSQEQNRQMAIQRLRRLLAVEIRVSRAATKTPSLLWQSRCKNERISVSEEHEDFAPLLAEALDAVAAATFDLTIAAEKLGVSTSQLLKLIRVDFTALEWVNAQRQTHGLRPLR